MKKLSLALAVLGVLLALVVGPAAASGTQEVRVQDRCDPDTFNMIGAVLVGEPRLCDPGFDGGVTFGRFLDALLEGGHGAWRFAPDDLHIDEGDSIVAVNEGGEFHTFTRVANFGRGFVPILNIAIEETTPAVSLEDIGASVLAPGESRTVMGLTVGTHLFECLIHPWQRATVEVRED